MSAGLQLLRDAFPLLVWAAGSRTYGGWTNTTPRWMIFVDIDLGGYVLTGSVATNITADLGADPITELRAIIAAEGARLAQQSDDLAASARMLGGTPQVDDRLATLTAAHEAIAGDVPPRGEDGHCTAARLAAMSEAALDPTA